MLQVLCPKLVLLLTKIFQYHMLKKHVFYTSEIPKVTWYEPLYNTYYNVIVLHVSPYTTETSILTD